MRISQWLAPGTGLFLRRDEGVSLLDQRCHGSPFEAGVEVDAQPSLRSYVRRPEEVLRLGRDQRFLSAGRSGKPDGQAAIVMVVVHEGQVLSARHEERGRAVRQLLRGVGKRET